MDARRVTDRIIVVVAVVACLAFVAGLFDVALTPFSAGPSVPAPPVRASERNARLVVRVGALPSARCAPGKDGGVPPGCNPVPLPGATARVFWEQRGRYYLAGSGRTDSAGRVVIDHLPRGAIWVVVDAPKRARSSTRLILGGETRTAEVTLAPAHSLTVSVRDDKGNALPRATVLVTAADPLPFGALTGLDGAAHLTRLGASPWSVKVSARGYESVTRSGVTADVTVTLRRLGSLDVRVETIAGSPVADASVIIAGSNLWPARRATTDGKGTARIAGLLQGTYDLKAEKGALVSDTLVGVELERGQHLSLVLRVYDGRMVTAVVTDGAGEHPVVVPDANVVLVESGISSFPIRGRSGADGTVTLGPLAPGPAMLAARADGFVPRSGVPVPDQLDGPVQIPLLKGATLEGSVVDAKGNPVDGATIEIIGTDMQGFPVNETPMLMSFRRRHFEWALPGPVPLIPAGELGVMPGPVPPIPQVGGLAESSPTGSEPDEDADVAPWVTGYDGTFTAHPVTPGRMRALIRHPAYVEAVSDAVTLVPGGKATVKVVLHAGGTLEGRVVDNDDQPVGGARVDLTAVEGTRQETTITAEDGTFAFAAVPDEIQLSLARPDDLSRIVMKQTIKVKEGEHKQIEIQLPAPRDPVQIKVTDDEDQPVDAAQVTVMSLDPQTPLSRTLFTTADGLVSVPDAKGLSLRVLAEAPGWARASTTTDEAPDEIAIKLRHGVLVHGTVTAVRGHDFLEGASVTVIADGMRKSALTDHQGSYALSDVAPGPVRLVVSHPEYATRSVDAKVEQTGRADRAFELPSIDLERPATVEGTVLDDKGKPVPAARVAVGVAPAYLPAGTLPPGMAVTDTDGHFKLEGVQPGTVDIGAYAADVGRGRTRGVRVDSDRPTTGVTIKLSPGASDDEPASGGSVAVTLGASGSGDSLEVVIVQVADGSEAEHAGLQRGDVITAVDGVPPRSMRDARIRLSGPVGSGVLVDVQRDDKTKRLRLVREQVRR